MVLVAGTLLIAGAASAAQLTLSWQDNSQGTAGFKVERKTGTTGTFAQIGTTGAGISTYVDTTVVAGTTYCYRVRASNAAGDSGYSNEACGSSATAAGLDVTASTAGTGSGTVTSSPTGITCGSDCFESFPAGAIVTLTATPASGSTFSGWTGGCSGTAPCTVTGNTRVTVTAAFATATEDSTRPVASITSAQVSGTMLNVSVAATDNVAVTRVDLLIDGQYVANRTAAPWTFSHSIGSLAAGSHTVEAWAYDARLNIGQSSKVGFTVNNASPVDSTKPVVSITSASVTGTTLAVSVAATDNVAVTRVDLVIDGQYVANRTAAPWTFSHSISSLGAGSHTVEAWAYDAKLNIGQSGKVAFTVNNTSPVDSTKPVVSITSASVSGTTLNVSVAATDNVAVTRVDLVIDGQYVANRTAAPWTFSHSISSLGTGSHTVEAWAYDATLNIGLSGKTGFTKN